MFYGGLILAVVVGFRTSRGTASCSGRPATSLRLASRSATSPDDSCLAAGCRYGRPADVPWAITFTNPLAAANVGTPLGIPLHPTQVYEAGAEPLILGLLLATERRGRPFAGRTFWAHVPLRDLAVHHRDLPRRPAR